VNVVLNAVLIPLLGMWGAAAATAVSYIFLWLFHLFVAKVMIKEDYHFDFRFFYYYFCIVLITIAVFYFIKDLWLVRWMLFITVAVLLLMKTLKQKSLF